MSTKSVVLPTASSIASKWRLGTRILVKSKHKSVANCENCQSKSRSKSICQVRISGRAALHNLYDLAYGPQIILAIGQQKKTRERKRESEREGEGKDTERQRLRTHKTFSTVGGAVNIGHKIYALR